MRDAHGVAGFEQLQRSLLVDAEDCVLNVRVGGRVRAAGDEFVVGFDVLGRGSADGGALHHNHVAGLAHGEIGLGGHDHSEGLQVGERFDVSVAVVIEREFAEVDGASLRARQPRERRSDIRGRTWWHLRGPDEFGVDFKVRLLAFHLGFARGALQQIGALKVDLGRSTLQAVVRGLGGARYGGRGGLRRRGVGDCAATRTAAAKKRMTRDSFFTSVLDLGEMRSG